MANKIKSGRKKVRPTKKTSSKSSNQTQDLEYIQNDGLILPQNNEDRFYCTNANLLKEMFKWKNSTKHGIPVLKKVNGRYVPTKSWKIITHYKKDIDENGNQIVVQVQKIEIDGKLVDIKDNSDFSCHEKYKDRTQYIIKYPKNHERSLLIKDKKSKINIVRSTKNEYIEDVTQLVKRMGYAFDIDDDEMNRDISNEFGVMMVKLGQKVSNHSFFRNYSKELKEDMQSYAYEKVIRGLPNYNFKYENAFAYLTQAFFNSFKSILSKHYKQINIKRACTKRAMVQLQSNLPNSSMEKCLGNQFRGNDFDSFEEF